MDRIQELIDLLKEKKREQRSNLLIWALGVVVAICAIAAIAYAVYLYFTPDYLEDFEDDDFEDDFDAYFEDEDKKVVPIRSEAEPQEETPSEEPADQPEEAPTE